MEWLDALEYTLYSHVLENGAGILISFPETIFRALSPELTACVSSFLGKCFEQTNTRTHTNHVCSGFDAEDGLWFLASRPMKRLIYFKLVTFRNMFGQIMYAIALKNLRVHFGQPNPKKYFIHFVVVFKTF